VFNTAGERIGHVEDLSIHKVSGQVVYALMSFGGFLGIGEQIHPLPWSVLDYNVDKGAKGFFGVETPLDCGNAIFPKGSALRVRVATDLSHSASLILKLAQNWTAVISMNNGDVTRFGVQLTNE